MFFLRTWGVRHYLNMGKIFVLSVLMQVMMMADSKVYIGGTTGMQELLDPKNSLTYRKEKGGLYLHNSGWQNMRHYERKRILALFRFNPVAIELGFGVSKKDYILGNIDQNRFYRKTQKWAEVLRSQYCRYGIRPEFIAVNAFVVKHNLPLQWWKEYSKALKSRCTYPLRIYPVIGYLNGRYAPTGGVDNKFSNTKKFQDLAKYSGGIVLDAPPFYFFKKSKKYKEWIIDAILWSKKNHIKTALIVSPSNSKDMFFKDTKMMLDILKEHKALPDFYIVENFVKKRRKTKRYINRIGNENDMNTILGMGYFLLGNNR